MGRLTDSVGTHLGNPGEGQAMPRRLVCLALLLVIALPAGCGAKPRKKRTAAVPKVKTRETLNKKTQVVLKLQDALAQGGVLAATTIPVADPLTQSAAGYRTSVGKIGA